MGSYFGTCSNRVTGCGPGNDGLYSFNGTTLARGSSIGGAIQARQVTGDPLSTDLYLEVVDGGIDRVQNPGGSPTISSFAGGSDNFDGLGWAPGGSVLYAVDTTTSHVVGFNRSGTEVFDVDLSAYQPTGLAVAPAGDSVNGVNISGNVFTDNLDGTVTRIDTTDGNAVSIVASGGGPGIAAFFDSQGHLDVAQPDSYVRLFGTPSAPQPPKPAVISNAKINKKKLTATFTFSAGGATGFQCELIRPKTKHHKQPKATFSPCSSPKTYKHLKRGRYTFKVRGFNAAGTGTSATKKFKI
jgi:hypothetical protein